MRYKRLVDKIHAAIEDELATHGEEEQKEEVAPTTQEDSADE